ncbi:MAG: hypothetical protein VKJ04_00170 [Vampirovibrionales bacterium]|nr:hypothetical protein [Vampirovibrionales bacterium]
MTVQEINLQRELRARQLLLESGVVEKLKEMSLYIWAINAHADRLILSLDSSLNPEADEPAIQRLLEYVLKELDIPIQIQNITIQDHCCYGNCKGCLNGSSLDHPTWIGRQF